MEVGECVYDISVRVCVSVPSQLFLLTIPHVWALQWSIPSLGISSTTARSKGALRGGMMKRYNLLDSAYCGRRIPLINPLLLSWRAVYKEGEWGKSCAGCFEEGGLRLDSDTHNNKSTRLCYRCCMGVDWASFMSKCLEDVGSPAWRPGCSASVPPPLPPLHWPLSHGSKLF